MKKIVIILFAGALMASLASCGGQKENKEAAPATTPTEQVKTDPTGTTADAEKALADYEKYVNSYIDVIKKMKAGDTKVVQEYSQYSQQLQQYAADMARYQIDFSPEQTKRWEAAQTKLGDALKSLNTKK